jgi:hypothetical protein
MSLLSSPALISIISKFPGLQFAFNKWQAMFRPVFSSVKIKNLEYLALFYKSGKLINTILKKNGVIIALNGIHNLNDHDFISSEFNQVASFYFKAFAVVNLSVIAHFSLTYNYLRFAAGLYQSGSF